MKYQDNNRHRLILLMFVACALAIPTSAPAQALVLPGSNTNINSPTPFFFTLGDIVTTILNYSFFIGGILTMVFLVIAGFRYVISAGDPKGVEAARGQITMALVGLFVIFIAYWLIKLVETILGGSFL